VGPAIDDVGERKVLRMKFKIKEADPGDFLEVCVGGTPNLDTVIGRVNVT
jgi:hypothetical protein